MNALKGLRVLAIRGLRARPHPYNNYGYSPCSVPSFAHPKDSPPPPHAHTHTSLPWLYSQDVEVNFEFFDPRPDDFHGLKVTEG